MKPEEQVANSIAFQKRSAGWLSRRLRFLFFILGLVWLLTALALFLGRAWLAAHFGEIAVDATAAWLGELSFFTFVGLILTLITLRDPAESDFSERLRILFGTDQIPDSVLQNSKTLIGQAALYIHEGIRDIEIQEYDEQTRAYRVRVQTTYDYRNLLPDIGFDSAVPLGFFPDKFGENRPQEIGRISSIKVGGVEQLRKPILIENEGFATNIPIAITQSGNSTLSYDYYIWEKVDAKNSVEPSRVIEKFTMRIVNRCDVTARISVAADDRGPVSLLFNQHYAFAPVQGYVPRRELFSFSFLPPAGQ
jgi:hypothetical protein